MTQITSLSVCYYKPPGYNTATVCKADYHGKFCGPNHCLFHCFAIETNTSREKFMIQNRRIVITTYDCLPNNIISFNTRPYQVVKRKNDIWNRINLQLISNTKYRIACQLSLRLYRCDITLPVNNQKGTEQYVYNTIYWLLRVDSFTSTDKPSSISCLRCTAINFHEGTKREMLLNVKNKSSELRYRKNKLISKIAFVKIY